MTDRLYYTDPYLRAFDATVTRIDRRDDRLLVTLDRTAFYPSSGGQPFDTGTLGSHRVTDVEDHEDGSITHVVDRGTLEPRTLEPGDAVHGEIDWPRRFDHMQQHSGQHVLSAAFDRLFDARTVSFHLGAAVSTIDLAREMTPAEIAAAEAEANRIVWEDRPVGIRPAPRAAADRLELQLRGRLRLGGRARHHLDHQRQGRLRPPSHDVVRHRETRERVAGQGDAPGSVFRGGGGAVVGQGRETPFESGGSGKGLH